MELVGENIRNTHTHPHAHPDPPWAVGKRKKQNSPLATIWLVDDIHRMSITHFVGATFSSSFSYAIDYLLILHNIV